MFVRIHSMIDDYDPDHGPRVGLNLDESAIRTLHTAVTFTLDKWAGQEPLDQEELIGLKNFLQAALFEFQCFK